MTRLLVVGAGGMTGWELVSRARARGFDCVGLERAQLDITDSTAVIKSVERSEPHVIINAAAYTAVDKAEQDCALAMRINGEGAGNLASAAEACGAAIVHISTDYVFDGTASTPYTPDHPTHPLGAYGQSKLAGEIAVKAQSRRHAIIRTSWVFSHRGHNFVRTMIGKMSAGHTLKVVDDQSGRPTAAGDLADALLVVAQNFHEDRSLSGTWHFANAGATTWYEFAGTIFEMRGGSAAQLEPIDSPGYTTPARRPPYSVLDTTSFEHTFGVTPRHWRDALRDTLEKMS